MDFRMFGLHLKNESWNSGTENSVFTSNMDLEIIYLYLFYCFTSIFLRLHKINYSNAYLHYLHLDSWGLFHKELVCHFRVSQGLTPMWSGDSINSKRNLHRLTAFLGTVSPTHPITKIITMNYLNTLPV